MSEISLKELQAPNLAVQAGNLAEASVKWRAAGMPMRTPDAIATIYAECRSNQCRKYIGKDAKHGQCAECGCNVSSEFNTWNKIALATEVCPLGLWPKKTDIEPADLTTPYRTEFNQLAAQCCGGNPEAVPTSDIAGIGGEFVAKFTERTLSPGIPGLRFNSSLARHPTNSDEYILAFRNGWKGSQIFLQRLDSRFKPIEQAWQLDLHHHLEASYGREDPRLFMHNDRLHIAYAGVVSGTTQLHTSVLYARLTADGSRVEEKWYPYYPYRNAWEKNWSFFEFQPTDRMTSKPNQRRRLYAVYSISPHRIAYIDEHQAVMDYSTGNDMLWYGGELRGGASPVLVGDEYWHFAHDRIRDGLYVYRTMLYTFASKPPFNVLRYTPQPILTADKSSKPIGQYCAAIFTCGAVRTGDDWFLSSGGHDRWTEIHRFSHSDLESRLVKV